MRAASTLLLLPLLVQTTQPGPKPPGLRADFHRGVCWVGPPDDGQMRRIVSLGADWISVTPFGYGQRRHDEVPAGGYRFSRHRGESPEQVRAIIELAHAHGVSVALKPHLWFNRDGRWRGDIAFDDEDDWDAWFAAYGSFLKPFVEIAAAEKVELLCIGTELAGTVCCTDRWTGMIHRIREIYPGKLTYAAHWDGGVERVGFWKELDMIGVQGYYPLVDFADRNPTPRELAAGWQPWMERLAAVSKKHGLPVLFTELGYKPRVGTTCRPWEWHSDTAYSPAAQAEAFEAFFAECAKRPFLAGVHVWKWFSYGRYRRGGFSPQGLPAEDVIRRWFRRRASASGARSR